MQQKKPLSFGLLIWYPFLHHDITQQIWWSEHLMECQLPECARDLEVKVANYDMVFSEGKVLKVVDDEKQQTNRFVLSNRYHIMLT